MKFCYLKLIRIFEIAHLFKKIVDICLEIIFNFKRMPINYPLKMLHSNFLIWIFCFLSITCSAQNYFQKIYKLEDSSAIFHDINIINDNQILIEGSVFRTNIHQKAFFITLDDSGIVVNKVLNNKVPLTQASWGSLTDSQMNDRGNFVTGFSNWFYVNAPPGLPRIIEADKNGNIVRDTLYDNFANDSVFYMDFATLIYSQIDSSYYMSLSFVDLLTDSNPTVGFDGEEGTLLMKLDRNYQIMWKKRFFKKISSNFVHFGPTKLRMLNDTTLFMVNWEFHQYAPSSAEKNKGITHYHTLDTAGLILTHKIFQATPFDYTGFAHLTLPNGDIISTYFESRLTGTPPNSDYFEHRSVMTRLNPNMQQVWKVNLIPNYSNHDPAGSPQKILQINDSTIVYAFRNAILLEPTKVLSEVKLESRNLNGNLNWSRQYVYYPQKFWNDPYYQILDVEQFSNGDLIFAGQVINDSLRNLNLSGQNGYLLKTNCLGFMGDPIANFTYSKGTGNEVIFVNQSAQAGGFVWDFGDNSSLSLGENYDTLTHVFSKDTIFTVSLKALGCNGKYDTISVKIDLLGLPEISATQSSTLTINPNPIPAGDFISVYIGNIAHEKHEIRIHNELGEVVAHYPVPHGKVNLSLNPITTKGIYFVSLYRKEEKVISKKIIIL